MTPSHAQTAAPSLLLETKLYAPRAPGRLVPRPRLSDRLDRGAASTLLLVSAPAGFGKTTLLAQWLATGERRVAWVSLDQGDNQPATFWTYVVAALQAVAPEVGATARALLRATQPATITTVLTTLINDLGASEGDIVLVLDDYDVIDAPEVAEGLAFLLDHAPPGLHLVVAGRADPALPLARLRGRGQLVEVRAADLRFTPEEAVAYLNGVMGLQLTAADVAALDGRTEGWIAALQLAALSLQGRDDATDFIASFAGDARYVVDYLVEEVLARQPDQVQRFLLQTSVLDRLSGLLCDAVTGEGGGRAMLQALDRANLFLVPLDDRRRWYRYHHLFADVLRARLLDEQPELVPALHRRASDWYERNGERAVAIAHALAAGDVERAADLVELAGPATRRDRQEALLRSWLEALPDELIQVRPVLSNAYAGSRLVRSEVEGVESRLRDAERWLDATSGGRRPGRPPGMVVVDEAQFRALPAGIAVHRAGLARLLGDVSGTVFHARRALDLVDADDHAGRGAATALLGLAYWTGGNLDAAHRWYCDGMAVLEKAGYLADLVGSAIIRADIRIAQGRLREAMSIYEQGLLVATRQAGPVLRGAADMHVGMAELLRERNDLPAALQHLQAGEELGEPLGLPQNPHRRRVVMARIRQAEGDLASAVDLLDEAGRRYVGDYSPDVRPVAAWKARVRVAQGRWREALGWAHGRGLSVDDDLSYLREFEHITLARALLAQHEGERAGPALGQAIGLLERLLLAAQDGARAGSVVEILMLLSLASQLRGDIPAALVTLGRALELAEPEGYVRLFVDEGQPMAALLDAASQQRIGSDYVHRLRAAPGRRQDSKPDEQVLIEPLSERERDVLRLLATDLGGPDIARELVVSLNTVRTHTRNVYAKLGVNNRRAAVRTATELGLLRTGTRSGP